MNAIRIRKKLDADTLHLPELQPLLGHTVEIIVLEDDTAPTIKPGTGNWEAAAQAARGLADYDFGAWQEQRQFDQQRPGDHLR